MTIGVLMIVCGIFAVSACETAVEDNRDLAQRVLTTNRQNSGLVRSLEFLGLATLPKELVVGGTNVGGLSGLVRQGETNTYYAICDDPSAGRFYQLSIDIGDGWLDDGDVTVNSVAFPKEAAGQPVAAQTADLEGIGLDADGRLWISSEGVAPNYAPWIRKFELDGRFVASLPVDPVKYDPPRSTPIAASVRAPASSRSV